MNNNYSLIISLFNESENLENLIKSTFIFKKKYKLDEIIFINNGSKDATEKILHENKKNFDYKYYSVKNSKGYGDGYMMGIKNAKNETIITNHADQQFSFEILEEYFKNKNLNKEFAIFPQRINRNNLSIIRSIIVRIICSIILNKKIPDVNGQPKMYPKKYIERFHNWPTGFAFDLFTYIILLKNNIEIFRPDTIEKKRVLGKSSWNSSLLNQINFLIIYIKDVLKIKKIFKNFFYKN